MYIPVSSALCTLVAYFFIVHPSTAQRDSNGQTVELSPVLHTSLEAYHAKFNARSDSFPSPSSPSSSSPRPPCPLSSPSPLRAPFPSAFPKDGDNSDESNVFS